MSQQLQAAKESMINWLSHPNELGKVPYKIECAKEFDYHEMHYYVFKFKEKMFDEWKLAVCGGYENDDLEHCGHIFSDYKKYNDKTAVDDAKIIVERIRSYWMERAKKQEAFNEKFKRNTAFRTQEEINGEDIEKQFVKTDHQYYLTVGEIDCPSGQIVVADPLAYLPGLQFSPVLAKSIPVGKYPVEVSLCRHEDIGIRMCSAKLKIKDSKVVKYIKTTATKESVIQLKDGTLEGFPVDAGMMCFCDLQVANEYRKFLDSWYESNPNKNHYDDYFAKFFAESEKRYPAYQRKDGDFIEWENPMTGNKMVMVSSGFGDGFYNSYYGIDENNEIAQIIVPMVNPDIFLKG